MKSYEECNFNSHASCEAWRLHWRSCRWTWRFQLTRLMRGVTPSVAGKYPTFIISTHTPHARRDTYFSPPNLWNSEFQLTRLMRGVTMALISVKSKYKFQLTRLMRGVTGWNYHKEIATIISTHTPHARRDILNDGVYKNTPDFNSHASCEAWPPKNTMLFAKSEISTHTPHARRDINQSLQFFPQAYFNSHASCEAWPACKHRVYAVYLFQLTRLMRGVTFRAVAHTARMTNFNSHASCEAWLRSINIFKPPYDFNSHASCEAWPDVVVATPTKMSFQLTRLMRGVTRYLLYPFYLNFISTHTPHARRDLQTFISRICMLISTHTPHARRDFFVWYFVWYFTYFNSHASCEAWPLSCAARLETFQFQLTRLMRGVTWTY